MALPASPLVLAWYAQFLTRTLKAHESIVNYLSGVKKLHQLLGFNIKSFSGFFLRLTLTGIRRRNKHVVRRSAPMTPYILEKIYTVLNFSSELDTVFWAALLTSFFLLLRKSNLVPNTKWGYNKKQQLRRDDILFTHDRAIVALRWSKTHQFTNELFTFPLPYISGSPLCPVKALNRLFIKIKIPNDKHLFAFSDGSSLTYRAFVNKLRLALVAAGIPNVQRYGGHSQRRGGCTFSFMCGIPIPVIKTLGMWRSDCYLKYLDFPMEARSAACQLMRLRILNAQHKYHM